MAAKGSFKNFLTRIGWDADDGEEEIEQAPVRHPAEDSRPSRPAKTSSSRAAQGGRIAGTGTRVVSMPGAGDGSVRMVVLQPQSYEDTTTIADQLKMGKPVIMNLEGLSKELGLRLLDFAIGASYALDGTIRRVSKGIFLIAPNGVDISGNISSSFSGNIKRDGQEPERRR